MSASKSKIRNHSTPVRLLQTQTDEEMEQTEQTEQLETEQLDSADNEMQFEFLEFLKSLDETPQADDDEGEHAQLQHELELSLVPQPPDNILIDTNSEHPPDMPFSSQPEPVLEHPPQQQQTLLQYNFIHKLYLAASSQQVSFINWSADGQQLQLDYIDLHEYLSGEQYIFCCQSVLQFTHQLLELGFERVLRESLVEEEDNPQLYFRHANFRAGQLDQLLLLSKSLSGDPLESEHNSGSSKLLQARCRFDTVLNFHNDERLLQEQEPSADQLLPRRGRISSSRQMTAPLLPALAAKHLNPRDSVLQFEAGQVPEYAGFYGRVKQTLVNEFFAEYLPRYGNRTCGYKDIIVDATRTNAFQQNLPIGMVYSEDEEDFDELDSQDDISADNTQKIEIFQPPDRSSAATEDIELEQVMQELCGVGLEGNVEELTKKEMTVPKSKVKRKKLVKKNAITGKDMDSTAEPSKHENDLLQPAAAAVKYVKDSCNEPNIGNDDEQILKSPDASKNVVKRRRYDLRNSKTKRTR